MIDKFDEIFENIIKVNNSKSMITELYEILPYLNHEELKNIMIIKRITNKYNLETYNNLIEEYINFKKRNRSLGLINSFTKMLKYASIEEKFRGYKITSNGAGANDNS